MSRDALDFLLARRSRPPKLLSPPAPPRDTLRELLTAAARVPDHGKLEPWRFIVLEGAGLAALRRSDPGAGGGGGTGRRQGRAGVRAGADGRGGRLLAEAERQDPGIEQTLSGARAALSLLNAALAAGWGASWMTGWAAYDRPLRRGLPRPRAGGVGDRLRLSRHLRDAAAGPAAAGRGGAHHLDRRREPRRRPRPRARRSSVTRGSCGCCWGAGADRRRRSRRCSGR